MMTELEKYYNKFNEEKRLCLLYTSDAADD